jgi:AraC-like DNA-binding protein
VIEQRRRSTQERIRRQVDLRAAQDVVRAGPLVPIRDVLRELGVDPGPVLARADFDARLLDDPEQRVDFDQVARLMHVAIDATGCQHLGLLLGQRFSPATMGLVYQLMKHSPSLQEALRAVVLHLQVHDRGGAPFIVNSGRHEVALAYGIYHRGEFDVAPIYDIALAIMFSFLRELCGPRWTPLRVTFPRRRPASVAPYRRLFGAPLVFDAEHASIVIADRWLDAPMRGADPSVRAALEELVRQREAAEALSMSSKVRRVLRSLVLTGGTSADQIAYMFSMSRRSLHRQLAADGTSLHLLISETRFEVARQLLTESDMPAGDVAAALHYADASAFSRAFKHWSGVSPRQWRLAIRRGNDDSPKARRSTRARRPRKTG